MPGHLQEMYESACEELDTKQRARLKSGLVEFGDVYAKSDLDLGNLNEVYHTIDTGSSALIKHKIRRPLVHFSEEEDVHMAKKCWPQALLNHRYLSWQLLRFWLGNVMDWLGGVWIIGL